ncbi:PEP-CTERM sorting domain-containing protein [Pseudomonadales bacterium]|nr:PEP-CTERM sorting domain-containing protein [Pseudomonadales bacterium]
MYKKLKIVAVGLLSSVLCLSAANAGMIVDVESGSDDINNINAAEALFGLLYVPDFLDVIFDETEEGNGVPDLIFRTHDLTDNGPGSSFTVGGSETIIGGTLTMNYMDNGCLGDLADDTLLGSFNSSPDCLNVLAWAFEGSELFSDAGVAIFSAGGSTEAVLVPEVVAILNKDGLINMGFLGFGNFTLGDSVLTLQTASVPEPGVLMLLGLGLIGLRVARPRSA